MIARREAEFQLLDGERVISDFVVGTDRVVSVGITERDQPESLAHKVPKGGRGQDQP